MPEQRDGTSPSVEPGVQGSTAQIAPDILSALGLTAKDVETFDRRFQQIKEDGKRAYGQIPGQYTVAADVKPKIHIEGIGNVPVSRKLEKVPDDIMSHFGGDSRPVEVRDRYMREIKTWLEGFGESALKADDWRTALNAFDIVTDGNVAENKELMDKLRGMVRDNKTEGVEIAKTMQGKFEKRVAQSAAQPAKPAPVSTPTV